MINGMRIEKNTVWLTVPALIKIAIIFWFMAASVFMRADLFAQESVLDGAKIKEALKKSEAAYFKNKKILSDLSDKSNDDISFVKKAYRLLLKKEAGDNELTRWVSLLSGGANRLDLIDELTSTDEYFLKNEVSGFVKTGSARLMQSPGFDSTSVMRIKKDESFKIISRQDEWYSVVLETGARGFIRSENIAINPPDLSGADAADGRAASDMDYIAGDDLQDFRRVYSQEISGLEDSFAKLKNALVIGDKYRPYEIKPGKLIDGEKYLTLFRSKTIDLSNKIEIYNSKNPIKHRIAAISCSYKDLLGYKLVEKLMTLQSHAVNAAALEVLENGESIVPTGVFNYVNDAANKRILKDFKQECDYRNIKKYALVDILNFGRQHFDGRREYFMKNAFGEYSSSIEKDRYFVDFTNPEVTALIFKYLEDIIKSGYFDAIIIDNLKMPHYPSAGNDIRALFIFNDAPVREFEKNTGLSVSQLNESHEEIFKKYAISKFENFVTMLRKFFASKKMPFYAVCDADYYSKKFDTRLCDFKRWGNNIDFLILRFNAADEKIIAASAKDTASLISRPQIICVSKKLFENEKAAFNFSDALKRINMDNNLIRGIFIEE